MTFGLVCWGGKQERDKMNKSNKKAGGLIGRRKNDRDIIYQAFVQQTAILVNDSHPLWQEFNNRRIDRSVRFRVSYARTACYLYSFILAAICLYNQIMKVFIQLASIPRATSLSCLFFFFLIFFLYISWCKDLIKVVCTIKLRLEISQWQRENTVPKAQVTNTPPPHRSTTPWHRSNTISQDQHTISQVYLIWKNINGTLTSQHSADPPPMKINS